MTSEQTPSRSDPFLEEVRRLKEEAVAGRDLRQLVEHLRELEKQYKDRLVQPPAKPDSSAA
jgi:hypothetical protein